MSKRQRLTLAGTAALAAVLLAACVQETPEPTTSPETPAPTSSTSPAPSGDASADESRCGVPGFEEQSSLVQGPEAQWSYIGSIAVPGSDEIGPGEITGEGVRTCFAHTAAGAVTMAYNALAQTSDAGLTAAWAEYAVSGPGRDELLEEVNDGGGSSETYRASLEGFRVLAYDGDTARIDVAFQVSSGGTTNFASTIFELVWESGDWRIYSESVDSPGMATEAIGSLSGYVAWSE